MKHTDIIPPIHISSTYEVTWDEARAVATGDETIAFYARYGNPTLRAVEAKIAVLCGGEEALVVASGMAAISLVPFALLNPGDEIVATQNLYGGTSKVFDLLERWGIKTKFVACDLEGAQGAVSARTEMLWTESPANPLNRLVPFEKAVEFARTNKLVSVIDATLGPPPLQSPLKSGFDLEVHAATKYLGGHSDLLAGAIVGKRETIAKLRAAHHLFGAVLDPRAAAELWRGLETLSLRVQHISASAAEIARRLEAHSKVEKLHYPTLASHPDYALAQEQMRGCGGIVSFELVENCEAGARRCVENLKHFRHAPSLGGTESLVSYPPLSSHANQSDEALARGGISRGTLRLSIGLEDVEMLWQDLKNSLDG